MKKTAAFGLILVFGMSSALRAQDEPQPQPEPAPEVETTEEPAPAVDDQADPEADAQPEDKADDKPVRGVRYRVELKTKNVLEGVIRAKGVFEKRANGGGYEPADENDEEAGVRLWFPSLQDGFVFVPLVEVGRLDELGPLSVDEGKDLARVRKRARQRADSERRSMREARAAAARKADANREAAAEAAAEAGEGIGPVAGEEIGADGADLVEQDEAAVEAELAALLLKYPPTRWSPETPDEIERRKVVLGLFPSDEEQAFLKVFDQWVIAYESWLAANGKEPEVRKEDEVDPTKRRSPRKKPKIERPDTPRRK